VEHKTIPRGFNGQQGHIVNQTSISQANDVETIAQAKQLSSGCAIELWNRDRLVKRLQAKTKLGDL
jgi:hypothetical protein